jgi:hypothetical protein
MKITISVIKADIGSIGGHICPSHSLLQTVRSHVAEHGAKLLVDHYVSSASRSSFENHRTNGSAFQIIGNSVHAELCRNVPCEFLAAGNSVKGISPQKRFNGIFR